MKRNKIILTEQEFTSLVKRVVNETINEIDGATYARVHSAKMGAQQRRLSGLPSTSTKRVNIEIITKGIDLDPRASDSLIMPYKYDYLFHCQNLLQAALLVFSFSQVYLLTPQKAILKGNVVFNGEPLNGSIFVDMPSHRTYYKYKGRKSEYDLTIDRSNAKKWNELLQQIDLAILKRQY